MRFLSTRRICASVLLVLSGWAAIGFGADASPEPQGELTLSAAIEAALARNPDLRASGYEIRAADARILQSGLRLNPSVSTELENVAGTGEARGVDFAELTLSLSQVVELGGKRALRQEVAGADRDFVVLSQRAAQLDVLAEVTRRYIAAVAAQERVTLTRSNAELAQKTLDAIVARVRAARSPEAERSRAQIVLTRARLDEEQAQSELRAARQSLSAMWGSVNPLFTDARAELFTLQDVQPFNALADRLERSPEFLQFASEGRLRDAEVRLAQAQARPDLTFSAGVRRLQGTRDQGLVAGFSMPLPINNRNQGAIREAQVRRDQNSAQRTASFIRARATLFSLYQEVTTSRARLQILTQEALPQARTALDQTQSGYDRGRFSFLELSTAQQELLALREAAISAAVDYHQTRTEIERLTSEPLTTGTEQDTP
jgi:cobalt-zinc-cadmium efflux system outer membrane protein